MTSPGASKASKLGGPGQLDDSDRLSAIGEAAAVAGHDLRNLLQAITNTVHFAKERAQNVDPNLMGLLNTIQEQSDYVNRIVTDLQDYANPVKPKFTQVDASKLIDDTLSALNIPETVEVSTSVDPGMPCIEADPVLLRRVLTNVVSNALQALPVGGRLSVGASRTDKVVCFSIQDDRKRVGENEVAGMFDPPFATSARGTGLGLPLAKRLVEAHGGRIRVESEPEKGTMFTIELPLGQSRHV